MTSQEIIKQLEVALRKHGTYQFVDKGADEVMDVIEIENALNALPVEEVVTTLETVAKHDNYGEMLVQSILLGMQSVEEERWDELMKSEILIKLF